MDSMKKRIKPFLQRNRVFHPIIKNRSWLPNIGSDGELFVEGSKYTLLMVVREGYDFNKPNANYMIRKGFCNGFSKLGISYKVVSVWDLKREIELTENPIIFLSFYDYFDFESRIRKTLRKHKHIVWVNPDNEKMVDIYEQFNFSYNTIDEKIYDLVKESEPSFIFTPSPETAFDTFSKWSKTGLNLVSVPLACDDSRYYPDKENDKYLGTDMAFVGGYWEKKSLQFDIYLRPFEQNLKVYGYTEWPYVGYSGLLPLGDESVLYQNAKVSPAISEPHAEQTGDIVERVFKVMGSGGLAITDVNSHYASLFEKEELLVPQTVDEYKFFVEKALNDAEFNQLYRSRGMHAIKEKHTYKHRAQLILEQLNLDI